MARARFVSRYARYCCGVQTEITEHFGTGEKRILKRHIDAQFHRKLTSDDDYAVALANFTFPGLPEDTDTNEHVKPRFRVSVWDSEYARDYEGMTDEEVDMCIARLRQTVGNDHVEVTTAPVSAPFPAYDELDPSQILEIVRITSLDPELVAAYERENQAREELIRALEGGAGDEEEIVVEA